MLHEPHRPKKMAEKRLCLRCKKHLVPLKYIENEPNQLICRVCVRTKVKEKACHYCDNPVCRDCGGCWNFCGWASTVGDPCNCSFRREILTETEFTVSLSVQSTKLKFFNIT